MLQQIVSAGPRCCNQWITIQEYSYKNTIKAKASISQMTNYQDEKYKLKKKSTNDQLSNTLAHSYFSIL